MVCKSRKKHLEKSIPTTEYCFLQNEIHLGKSMTDTISE